MNKTRISTHVLKLTLTYRHCYLQVSEEQGDTLRIYSRKNRACATQGEIQNAVSVFRIVKDRLVFHFLLQR